MKSAKILALPPTNCSLIQNMEVFRCSANRRKSRSKSWTQGLLVLVLLTAEIALCVITYNVHFSSATAGSSSAERPNGRQKLLSNEYCARSLSIFGSDHTRTSVSQMHRASYNTSQYMASTPNFKTSMKSSRLRVMAISTKGMDAPKSMCQWTLFSAALNKIPLEIYGASPSFQAGLQKLRDDETTGDGKSVKVDCMLSMLCAMDSSESVLMVDAFDVIFQRPFDEIEHLYFKRWNAPEFTVSTESNCWPNWVEGICGVTDQPPVPPGGTPYINSGVMIGSVEAFKEVMGRALDQRKLGVLDDQAATARVVYENVESQRFLMDHLSELSSAAYPPKPIYNEIEIEGRGYFVDPVSKTVPMMIHLNGDIPKDVYGQKMWYLTDGRLNNDLVETVRDYVVSVDGERVTVGDMCSSYF
ncbi:hypothetical protein CcCBS67573_g07237 [Chytriomyces confervae]|uniref:PLOD1-3-like GT domain-containing protein n=1 Tax=Chytriomyces confervae TaxID=246404 RepID=A0A507EY36_9FUNG|nr:hypothetical protein CcCBS67573_g07237 [Chytriomyces confervae]